MLYQFISWHLGFGRRMVVVQVEQLFARLRGVNGGRLPFHLRNFEQRAIFAGECAVALPENQRVAESIIVGDAYPTMAWLDERYADTLAHVKANAPELMTDPPPPKVEGTEATLTITPADLDKINAADLLDKKLEGSVSNTEGRETCSDQPPLNSVLGSTSTVLPNSALTTSPETPPKPSPSPQQTPNSTRTRQPKG